METKVCNICKEEKGLIDNFYKARKNTGGYQHMCKSCDIAKSTKWQRESGYNKQPKRLDGNKNRKAKSKVRQAIKRGDIKPVTEMECVDCGEGAKNYHHEDYDKPLEVVPLCTVCHSKRHQPPPLAAYIITRVD